MDSLFLMQRYWGSDDDSDAEKNYSGSNPSSSISSNKLNVGISAIENDNQDDKICDREQVTESHNSRTSTKNKLCRNEGLNVPVIEIDNSDFPNKLNSVSETDSEVEILDNAENDFCLKESVIHSEEIFFVNKNNVSKKKKHKINDLDAQENDEITYLENNILKKGKKCKLSNLDAQETDGINKNNVSKKKKHKIKDLDAPENDEITYLENNLLKKSKKCKLSDLDTQETDGINKNNVSKKKKHKINDLDAQENDEITYLDNNLLKKSKKCKLSNLDTPENDRITHVENSITQGGKNKLNNPHDEEITHLEKSMSKKKKQKLNNLDTQENEDGITNLENRTSQKKDIDKTFCTIGQIHHLKDIKVKHALPHWLCNPTYISVNLSEKETPISELNYLDSNTKKNFKNAGINFLFPVQLAVIPWLMQSKEQSLLIRPSDICVSAPTGSGKTLAFVVPIVQSLKDRVVCSIRALVVLPVNELAFQVYKVFEIYIHGTDLKVALLTGQKSFATEQNALIKSDGEKFQNLVDIVVTTPGRLLDHIYRTKGFCLKRLRYLVIDEADRMMEEIQQGWLKEVEDAVFRDCITSSCVCSSFKRTPFESSSAFNFGLITQPLQKLLYSATLTHDPEQLYSLSLYKPKLFTTSYTSSEQEYTGTYAVPSGLTMLQVICEEGVKPIVICHLIKQYNFKRVLCFTESIERAHRLHLVLEKMGILQVREISSFNRAVQRKIVLEQFSSGKIDILVCSDIVARGIDIENIDCVISYDVPQSVKTYIHRIGRTARAGKTGTAITLLSEGEISSFRKILLPAGIKMPEKVIINSEDLKPLVNLYKTALSVADVQLKKEKVQVSGKAFKKDKRKCETSSSVNEQK